MEKVAIGIMLQRFHNDVGVRSITCQNSEYIADTLTSDLMAHTFVDRVIDLGSDQQIHESVSDFIDGRVEEGCKHLYIYDEPEEEYYAPTWYYTYVNSPEVGFTHWRNLNEEYVEKLLNGDKHQTMKYKEIQPSVYHIVPDTITKGYDQVVITVDNSGNGIGNSIHISNFEDVEGVDIPTEAIPAVIDRLQKVWTKYLYDNPES